MTDPVLFAEPGSSWLRVGCTVSACTSGRETLRRVTSPQSRHPDAQHGSPAGSTEDGTFGDDLDADATSAAAPSSGLGERWRLAVAGVELLVVVALVLLTWWAWGNGTVLVDIPSPVGASGEQDSVQQVTRSVGNWQASSVGSAVLAGLVLLDLCRQLWLAPRLRRGR